MTSETDMHGPHDPTSAQAEGAETWISTSDGARLHTMVMEPEGAPAVTAKATILMRSPYGMKSVRADAKGLARAGYRVIIQSCRGTFESSGEFVPFDNEQADAAATFAWIDQNGWSDPLVLLGGSYLGFTAWAALAADPQRPTLMILAQTAASFHTAVIAPRGVFGIGTVLVWLFGMSAQEITPFPRRLLMVARALRRLSRLRPSDVATADEYVLGGPSTIYRRWHRDYPHADRWQHMDFRQVIDQAPPTLHVAGWQDLFLEEQLNDYSAAVSAGRTVRLVVGPWKHGGRGQIRAFKDESLRALASPSSISGLKLHDGGRNKWVELEALPPTRPVIWRLGTKSLSDHGKAVVSSNRSFIPNPGSVAKVAGGRTLVPANSGRHWQAATESRHDVLTWTSAPLTSDVTISGRCLVRLATEANAGSHDWFVRLCDVRFGISRNLTDGLVRKEQSDDGILDIELAPTYFTFRRGSRIRLQVTAMAFPIYEPLLDEAPRRVIPERSTVTLPTVTRPSNKLE